MVDGHAYKLEERLWSSRDKQAGMRWPVPVDDRLDRLVARAVDTGERTTRRELLAAIVATLDLDGNQLGQLLRKYRTMTVGDTVLDRAPVGNVIHISDHKPGPRRVGGEP